MPATALKSRKTKRRTAQPLRLDRFGNPRRKPANVKNKPQGGGVPISEGSVVRMRAQVGEYMTSAIEVLADAEGISMSAWTRDIMRKHLQRRGMTIALSTVNHLPHAGSLVPEEEGRPVDLKFSVGNRMANAIEWFAYVDQVHPSTWIRDALRFELQQLGTVFK